MNNKELILSKSMQVIRSGTLKSVTLDSVAKSAGLTIPGLMYHFPTKQALLIGIVDYSARKWDAQITKLAGGSVDSLDVYERYDAYAKANLSLGMNEADYIVMTNASQDNLFNDVWLKYMEPWLDIPNDMSAHAKNHLSAARYIAEGYWVAKVTKFMINPSVNAVSIKKIIDFHIEEARK